jgi:hypothetical protein
MSIEKTCFVICPIGDEGSDTRKRSDDMLKYLIRPAADKCGHKAVRADEIEKSGNITKQVIDHIIESNIVIADLAECNPNVFYELGIRHSSGKPVILIAEHGQSIPFDISHERVLFLKYRDWGSLEECRERIVKRIQHFEEEGATEDVNIWKEKAQAIASKEHRSDFEIFAHSDDPKAIGQIQSKIENARRIDMYGIALNVLWNTRTIDLLLNRAMIGKVQVTILLADVDSPHIKIRLDEEDADEYSANKGRQIIENTYNIVKKIEKRINNPDFFRVGKFSHYPTFALIIVDEDLYCYPYGYRKMGTHAPMLHLKDRDSPQASYYIEQFKALVNNYFEGERKEDRVLVDE